MKAATKKKTPKSLEKGFQKIPLISLVMAQWNYKKFNNPELQKKLVANIKKNGQIENLITHENSQGEIVVTNGNHRYLAMQELKFETADCYHLGKISDAQAKRIAIETNETKFATDKTKLAELLDEVMKVEGFEDFSETNPFEDKEMEKLAKLLLDDEMEDDENPKEKPQKSKTMVSAGGVKYTTVKLELSLEMSQRFNNALARFNFVEGAEKPLDILLRLAEKYTNEEILEITGQSVGKKKSTLRVK